MPLDAGFGDDVKRRFAQGDQDAFERRALSGGDDAGGVTGEEIDLAGGECGHRQRSSHLNQFRF